MYPQRKYTRSDRRLCKPGLFERFYGKYQGVVGMYLLTNGDRRVLLIGETHGRPSREGFPVFGAQEVLEALDQNANVDFFLEVHKSMVRGVSEWEEGTMNTLRKTLVQYIPSPKKTKSKKTPIKRPFRVHWADYDPDEGFWAEVNAFFVDLNALKTSMKALGATPPPKGETLPFSSPTLQRYLASKNYSARLVQLYRACYEESPDVTSQLAVDWMLEEGNLSKNACARYRDVYVETLTARLRESTAHKGYALFLCFRFFMDVFTFCRMMRSEGRWYKNMVLYAGHNHVRNVASLLLKSGFVLHDVDRFNTYDVP
jgi:hypothetical protein